MPHLEATVADCFHVLEQSSRRRGPTATATAIQPTLDSLDWAPEQLRAGYPPVPIPGADGGIWPIVLAFRNGELCRGTTGPWCTGHASWFLVQKGPVLVLGIDLDQCIHEAAMRGEPIATMRDLEYRMLAGDDPGRVKLQALCSSGEAVWVPQGTAVALFGLADGGMSAVLYSPWLCYAIADEHMMRNAICARSIARVASRKLRYRCTWCYDNPREKTIPAELRRYFDAWGGQSRP
jgi:hypothetical protein